jgi:hypothetical protein
MKKLTTIITFAISTSLLAQSQLTNNGNLATHIGANIAFFGNFSNNGTCTDSGQAVYFNGSLAQTIGGTITVTFNNLTINNTSGGVSLAMPENVAGILVLSNGILTTTSTNILTLNAGAASSSGNVTSFVDGPMTKIGNTAFVFPLGNGATWARLGITAPPTVGNKLTAQYFHNPYITLTPVNAPLTNVSSKEYWTLSESVPGDSVKVTLYWESATASGILSYNNSLRVAHFNGASWDNKGQNSITASSPGNVTSNYVSSFSPFTFGSTNSISNPLPIQLLSFTAIPNSEGHVDLNWSTATETNNREFTVEKTQDGTIYSNVVTIPGAGNSSQTLDYTSTDENPYLGISYYRLKQTDFDGTVTYSGLKPIEITPNYSVNIYPNPVREILKLNIYTQVNTSVDLKIFDLSGQLISGYILNSPKGNSTYSINIANLPDGLYFLQCDTSLQTFRTKFIKQ